MKDGGGEREKCRVFFMGGMLLPGVIVTLHREADATTVEPRRVPCGPTIMTIIPGDGLTIEGVHSQKDNRRSCTVSLGLTRPETGH